MPKARKVLLVSLLLVVLLTLSFAAGCFFIIPDQSSSGGSGISAIEQAWSIIHEDYVDRSKLDDAALSKAAIKAMIEALNDPHTAYIDAEAYQLSVSDFEGKFEGIGAQVGIRDNQIVIIAPLPDSPAANAGIKPGDALLEIDSKSTEGMSLAEVVLKIRGQSGTTVSLVILHEGDTTPQLIEIVRAEIKLQSARLQMREELAYLRIDYFSERTNDELAPLLDTITGSGAKGIILDLRANPGGVLQAVIDVASRFVKEGVIVDVVDNEGKHTASSVKPGTATIDLPMVVLVDAYSASGSEVLSGALQDHKRVTVAGTRTFGKGSVNILRRLSDGSGIYITTGRWLTPNGRLIEGQGLEPDIELTQTGEDAVQWAMGYLRSEK